MIKVVHDNIGVDHNFQLHIIDESGHRKTNFWLTEMVSKKVFMRHGYYAVYFVELKALKYMQWLRERYNVPITVNNWWDGGYLHQRGYRSAETTVGVANSMHRFRLAQDFDVNGMTANQVRQDVADNPGEFYNAGLRRVEDDVWWNHHDFKPADDIIFFNPPASTLNRWAEKAHRN